MNSFLSFVLFVANESIRESLDLLNDEFGVVELLQNPPVSLVVDIIGDPIFDATPMRHPVGVGDTGATALNVNVGRSLTLLPHKGGCKMETSPLNSSLAALMQHLFIKTHRLSL